MNLVEDEGEAKNSLDPAVMSSHLNQNVPRICVQSLLLHQPRLRDRVWSPGLPPSIYTRALKVRYLFISSFSKYLLSTWEVPLSLLGTMNQAYRYSCAAEHAF